MFNLEALIAGEVCLTMEGYEVKFVAILPDETIPARLIVDVASYTRQGKDGGYQAQSYYLNGKFFENGHSLMDLRIIGDMMELSYLHNTDDKSRQVWLSPTSKKSVRRKKPDTIALRNKEICAMLRRYGWSMDEKSEYYFDFNEENSQIKAMVNALK
jgi:hypothetical protein